jgi:hypothetical protein
MSEWWTYGLSDFLLFSPRTYYRLIERHNAAVWPGQLVTITLGLGVLGLLRRPGPRQGRAIAACLAVLWAWVGWGFVWSRYATINWAAGYLALLFAAEAVLLLSIGVAGGRLAFGAGRSVAGLALFVAAVLLYPLLAPFLGRGVAQSEVFGIVPDPTAVGTIGLVLLAHGRGATALLAVPLLWCLVAAATLWAMGSVDGWFPALALAITGAVALARRRASPV